MQRVLTSVRVFGFHGISKIRADGGLCRTAPGSGRYFCKHAPHKEDAFLRRHPAQEIVISLTVLDTKLTGRMRLAEQRTPFGHPVFLQHRAEDALMSSFWKIRKFWRRPARHSGGCTFMLYSIWFLSFSRVQTRSPRLSPGAVLHRPAISSGRPFCPAPAQIQGEKLLADQGEIEEKSEESDWFR